jgi:hypothetical protein
VFSFEECAIIMVWLLALPIICLAAAVFLWRFERYLGQLTGPLDNLGLIGFAGIGFVAYRKRHAAATSTAAMAHVPLMCR